MDEKRITKYWEAFLAARDHRDRYADRSYRAWHFCDNREDADALAALVLSGEKRATTSLRRSYDTNDDPLPEVGDLSIILDWSGTPRCVIETTEVREMPFLEVGEDFARMEGEGDLSLEYWRRVHREAFGREAVFLGFSFTEDLTVLCETFRVIYR